MKIENYLNSISKKEFIYILISIPIIFFVLYYNFIYPTLTKNTKRIKYQIQIKERKLIKLKQESKKIKISKDMLIPTRKKLENLIDDYKFIKYNLATISLLYLNDPKIFTLLKKILKEAKILNLNTSMSIEWIKPSNLFNKGIQISISGKGKFINIARYLEYLTHLNSLITMNNINIYTKQPQKELLSYLSEKNKANSSFLSITIYKYSNRDIEYLKNFAKIHNLKLSISMQGLNAIKMFFKGNYQSIYILNNTLENMSQSKQIKISNKKISIYRPKQFLSNKTYLQNFDITFTIMGIQ